MLNKKKEKIEILDILRGISILFIVLGHQPIKTEILKYIFVFHVYIFFFISGATYDENKIKKTASFILKNIKKLLVPYFIYSLIWIVFFRYYSIKPEITFIGEFTFYLQALKAIFYGTDGVIHLGPAWFLVCLFTVRILYHFLRKCIKNNTLLICILVSLSMIGYYWSNHYSTIIPPFSIHTALIAILFYGIGNLSKDFIINLKGNKYNIYAFILLTIITYLSSKNMPLILVINNTNLINYPLIIFGASCGILSYLILSRIVLNLTKIKNILIFFGENTIIIMGLHSIIRTILYNYLWSITNMLIYNFIMFTVTILCMFIIIKFKKLLNERLRGVS